MDLLSQLNSAQRTAVEILEGPVLVLAGPGSGKTRVLTYRVAYLARECGIDPHNIMAVTFTNKAAREMRSRVGQLIGEQRLGRLTIGTFHAICARLLHRESKAIDLPSNFVIYDRDDQLSLVREGLKELNLDDKMYRPVAIQAAISKAKRALLTPDEYNPPTYWHEVAGRVYSRYQRLLRANNALDFDDLLMLAVRLLSEHKDVLEKYQRRYVHVLVDEFQDTDSAQYQLVRMLTARRKNLFVVGDEDQSIYGWRGADFRNIRRFRQDFPDAQVVLLEQNYRSTQNILDAARHVISRNTWRTEKRLWTKKSKGLPITIFEAYDEQEEAEFIVRQVEELVAQGVCRLGDCAVMYRTNAQSRVLEDAFMRHGLPYKLVGATRFYERREIKDVLAYLRLIHNPYDDVSLRRILNVPPRGIGAKTQQSLENWAQVNGVPLYTALQLLKVEDETDASAQEAGSPPPEVIDSASVFSGRSSRVLLAFLDLLDGWMTNRAQMTVLEHLDQVLVDSGYADYVRDGTEEGEERWENIQELRTVARDYQSVGPEAALGAFLEGVALVSDVDNLRDEINAATLLTLHTAKGLEFEAVFVAGLEEGILPHSRSMDEPEEMEEERRLCYVGMTRAKSRLYLIHTFRRTRFGNPSLSEPSRFLRDIPGDLVNGTGGRAPARRRARVKSATPQASVRRLGSFAPGDRVQHPQFGEGIVVSSQARDGDEEVIVAFVGRAGIKRLMASFAGLKRLSRPE
jgi:DNA helicase-2/ATP-dependent DNA helicase PcrA